MGWNTSFVGAAAVVIMAHVLIAGFVMKAWQRGLEEEAKEALDVLKKAQ